MAFMTEDPKVGDLYKIVYQQVGYDPIDRSSMYFMYEGTTVRVVDRFEGDDVYGKKSKFVVVIDVSKKDVERPVWTLGGMVMKHVDRMTVKVGTLLHGAGLLESPALEGRGFYFDSELHSASEGFDKPSGGHLSALEQIKAQMEANEEAARVAAATPGVVVLARELPAPNSHVAGAGTSVEVITSDGNSSTIKAPEFPLPVIVAVPDLAACIAV